MKNLLFKLVLVLLIISGGPILEAQQALYNLTISDSHRFVWFRVAKVGTRSILKILNENNVSFIVNDYNVPYKAGDYPGFFKFAFVRNPWERVVSCYCNKVLTKGAVFYKECYDKDFEYFVNFINRQDLSRTDPHIRLQTSLFPFNELDFIGRMESFEEDLSLLLLILGIPEVTIPRKNATNHEHYSHYYNDRTRKIIAKKYQRDIRAFKYTFETE